MSPPKSKDDKQEKFNLTPSEVKANARKFFSQLEKEGHAPWPHLFLSQNGFHRLECEHCHKKFWSMNKDQKDCGDSECAGGYHFLHPDTPPEKPVTYYEAWQGFKNSMETNEPVPYHEVRRYPVVARWRSDVDFVAAGIYCFQPFCVTGESDPPENPLCACQFCLRFNDLDNIGITGRHYSGFNMLGIQVFNRADKMRKEPLQPYGEYEEVFWKDTLIANNYRWATETLHLDPKRLTFIEDVWAGGGNCGACVEYFYAGLEIGNMVFTEYSVNNKCEFTLISTKVIDVGIGLERIPWLCNGGWTSYLYVFDYILPYLSNLLNVPIDTPEFRAFAPHTALFDADECDDIEGTWRKVAEQMGFDDAKMKDLRERLQLFADLVILCDHTRTVLFAIEDGALPSNNGGAANIRNVLRRAFHIIEKRNWFEKLGGVEGIIKLFKLHIEGLSCFTEFTNIRCLEDCIALEWQRYVNAKDNSRRVLKSFVQKWRGKEIPLSAWFEQMTSNGVSPEDIVDAIKTDDPKRDFGIPDKLWLEFENFRCRTHQGVALDKYKVDGIPETVEIFNLPENEYVYEAECKVVHRYAEDKLCVDKTIMYATQGGQEHDDGVFVIDGKEFKVLDIEKIRKVVIFTLDGKFDDSVVGKSVTQKVDAEVREILRVQHSATHIVAAAARKVLGPHVWQNGAKKTKTEAHIDLTHYELPSYDQVVEIQRVANELIMSNLKVTKSVFSRKDAECKYGFTLYQGGAIPGNEIRVVNMGGVDIEACCGTHVDQLSQIGQIRILGVNNIQDGVFRCRFVAGKLAINQVCNDMVLLREVCNLYSCLPHEIMGNCTKFFSAKNSLESQCKRLTEQVINLEIKVCSLSPSDKCIISRNEDDGSGYIKGLQEGVKKLPEAANKSIFLLGPSYLVGSIQPSHLESIKGEIEKILDSEGKDASGKPINNKLVVSAPKKAKQQGKKKANAQPEPEVQATPVQCMKISSTAMKAIKELLAKDGYI